MSNYADPDEIAPFDLGACRCPGTPHGSDSVDVVRRLGYGDRGKIRDTTRRFGVEAGYLVAIRLAVKRWNLVLPDGTPRPLDAQQIALLDEVTVEQLIGEGGPVNAAFEDDPLPKASSGTSPDGSSERDTSTPTTPEPTASTTP